MALKVLPPMGHRPRSLHTVRFTSDDLPKYKPYVSSSSPDASPRSSSSYPHSMGGADSGAPSPDACHFQPAAQRVRINEQRIKLLTTINQIVQQRSELENNRVTLSNLLEELKRKLKRKIEECHQEKKEQMKALKLSNLKLEKEKTRLSMEVDHLKRHLQKEEQHHANHARTHFTKILNGVPQKQALMARHQSPAPCAISDMPYYVSRNVAKNAPSKVADNKLAAARLMRDIAELRHRVARVESRLTAEIKRKRQAELDIARLRRELANARTLVSPRVMSRPSNVALNKVYDTLAKDNVSKPLNPSSLVETHFIDAH